MHLLLLLLLIGGQGGEELDSQALEWFAKGENLIGTDQEASDLQAEYFEKALSIQPGFAPAHLNLVLIYLQQNKPEKALPHCEALLELDPSDPRGFRLRARIRSVQGERSSAIQDLVKASRLDPKDYRTWE